MPKPSPVIVKFWGVRGGIAAPGEGTLKFGGNTACTEIRMGGELFVIDCGTGGRELGRELMGRAPVRLHLLFTDYRWDHIQGFPFFTPVYIPTSQLDVRGPVSHGHGVKEMLSAQMKFPVFPIQLEHLNAKFTFQDLSAGESFQAGSVEVSTLPGSPETLGYRLEDGERSVVILPEIGEARGGTGAKAELVRFSRKASLVVFHATVPASLNGRRPAATRETWDAAVSIARAAKARRMVVFHHSPDDDDRALESLERRARRVFGGALAAYEGMRLEL